MNNINGSHWTGTVDTLVHQTTKCILFMRPSGLWPSGYLRRADGGFRYKCSPTLYFTMICAIFTSLGWLLRPRRSCNIKGYYIALPGRGVKMISSSLWIGTECITATIAKDVVALTNDWKKTKLSWVHLSNLCACDCVGAWMGLCPCVCPFYSPVKDYLFCWHASEVTSTHHRIIEHRFLFRWNKSLNMLNKIEVIIF